MLYPLSYGAISAVKRCKDNQILETKTIPIHYFIFLSFLPSPGQKATANHRKSIPVFTFLPKCESTILKITELINGKFQPVQGSEKEIPADLVFLALGFTGPEKNVLLDQLEVKLDEKGNIIRDHEYSTDSDGVFVCGDAGRGQSLIVWAIAEGRSAAAAIDKYLTGNTQLPYPIEPTERPLMV
jgi:hypothetical protein